MLWYYDEYVNDNDLMTRLYTNFITSVEDSNFDIDTSKYSAGLSGTVDRIPELSVTHNWTAAGNAGGFLGGMMTGIAQGAHDMYKFGEGEGAVAAKNIKKFTDWVRDKDDSHTAGVSATTTAFNSIITGSADMLKKFAGTDIDISIPTFTKYYFHDSDRANIRQALWGDLSNCLMLGDSDTALLDSAIVSFPPNGFRFSPTLDPSKDLPGTFAMVNSRFILRNLVPATISVIPSEAMICGSTDPMFLRLDITFTFARRPTQPTAKDFITFASSPSSYDQVYSYSGAEGGGVNNKQFSNWDNSSETRQKRMQEYNRLRQKAIQESRSDADAQNSAEAPAGQ